MQMSRPELDGWLDALQTINGGRPRDRKQKPGTSHLKFKSVRRKRKKKRNGR